MNELARQQYLEAMGIEVFCPRYILPSAQPSSACALPVEWVDELPSAVTEANSVTAGATSQVRTPIESAAAMAVSATQPQPPGFRAELLNEAISHVGFDSTQTQALERLPSNLTLREIAARQNQPQLQFSFAIWSLDNGVVFVDTRAPKEALPTTSLLGNIVRALAPSIALPSPEMIDWPLPGSPRAMGNTSKNASEMVCAFLASRFQESSPTLIVAMGAIAGQMLLASDQLPSDLSGMHDAEHLPCPLALTPSLTGLLQQPLAKRILWPMLVSFFHSQSR